MLDNDLYNLMEQLVEESQSLQRIKKHYKVDAKDCSGCKSYWDKLEKDKEQHIKELTDLIKEHM